MCAKNIFAFTLYLVTGLIDTYIIYTLFNNVSVGFALFLGTIIIGLSNYFIYAFFYYLFLNYMKTVFNGIDKGDLSFKLEKSQFYLPKSWVKQLNNMIDTLNNKIYCDTLTHLPNRSALFKSIDLLKEDQPENILITLLDIDDFKSVNDTYGHQTGDKLLQLTAQRLSNQLPENAQPYRLSGDEFVIITISEQPINISQVKQKIHSIFTDAFNINNVLIPIKVSIGCTYYDKYTHNIISTIKDADNEMYQEKNNKKRGD